MGVRRTIERGVKGRNYASLVHVKAEAQSVRRRMESWHGIMESAPHLDWRGGRG